MSLFYRSGIENDIDPREIAINENHNKWMDYLMDLFKALNKTVVLKAENEQGAIYIVADKEKR